MQPNIISLDSIQIATPCRADWNAMSPVQGNECVRFCRTCGKNVYNLSGMKREEAVNLIQENEGNLCVRLHRRSDGTLITSDCPVGMATPKGRWPLVAAFVGFLIALLGLAGLFESSQVMAGGISIPTPSATPGSTPPLNPTSSLPASQLPSSGRSTAP